MRIGIRARFSEFSRLRAFRRGRSRSPVVRLSEIMAERRSVTADTAHRLSHFFGTTPEFWMNLQAAHDLSKAEAEADYSKIRPVKTARRAA